MVGEYFFCTETDSGPSHDPYSSHLGLTRGLSGHWGHPYWMGRSGGRRRGRVVLLASSSRPEVDEWEHYTCNVKGPLHSSVPFCLLKLFVLLFFLSGIWFFEYVCFGFLMNFYAGPRPPTLGAERGRNYYPTLELGTRE